MNEYVKARRKTKTLEDSVGHLSGSGDLAATVRTFVANRKVYQFPLTDPGFANLLGKAAQCKCCQDTVSLCETDDGQVFCGVCGYSVVRCGWCVTHRSTPFLPTLAGNPPPVVPPELLAAAEWSPPPPPSAPSAGYAFNGESE
jgi:hypothetical protein